MIDNYSLVNEDDSTKIEILRRDFSINDFLEDEYTRNILEKDFLNKVNKIDDDIIDYYKDFISYNMDSLMLSKDGKGKQYDKLLKIIYNNISKDYDIQILYNNPTMLNHLLMKYELNTTS
tara:strand:+ start:50 stop:409 length:360 start_codon:yes stop_codon:yes gene_type:complete